MGWPVGRVLYAEAWRPSIYDDRCRPPPAVYPRTRAGRPRTCAHPGPEGSELLDLAPGGVCRAGRVTPVAGGLLHHRFTLTCPLPGRRSVLCGTFPRVTPGGRYPPPCPVEPGPSSAPPSRAVTRSPGQPIRVSKDRADGPAGRHAVGGRGHTVRMTSRRLAWRGGRGGVRDQADAGRGCAGVRGRLPPQPVAPGAVGPRPSGVLLDRRGPGGERRGRAPRD